MPFQGSTASTYASRQNVTSNPNLSPAESLANARRLLDSGAGSVEDRATAQAIVDAADAAEARAANIARIAATPRKPPPPRKAGRRTRRRSTRHRRTRRRGGATPEEVAREQRLRAADEEWAAHEAAEKAAEIAKMQAIRSAVARGAVFQSNGVKPAGPKPTKPTGPKPQGPQGPRPVGAPVTGGPGGRRRKTSRRKQ